MVQSLLQSNNRQCLDRLMETIHQDLNTKQAHPLNRFISMSIKKLNISEMCDVGDIVNEVYPVAIGMIDRGETRDNWYPTLKKIALNRMRDKRKKLTNKKNTISKIYRSQNHYSEVNICTEYSEILDKIGVLLEKDRTILILRAQGQTWEYIAQALVGQGHEVEDSRLVERVKKYGNRLATKLRKKISPEDLNT